MKVLRITAFAAALTILTSTLVSMPVYAVEAPVATATTEEKQTYTGSCGAEGSNITWTLDTETDTLTFSGTGTIKTYDGPKVEKFENPAWNMYGVSINHIIVEEGITDIGSFTNSMFHYSADSGCERENRTITIPESVTNWDFLPSDFLYQTAYGSKFYYSLANSKTIRLECTDYAKNPVYPTTGTSALGGSWKFDYAEKAITISGPGFVDFNEINMYPFTKIILDASVTIADSYQDKTYSLALLQMFQQLKTISDMGYEKEVSVFYDENSDFQQEFEKLPESIRSEAERIYATQSILIGDADLDGRITLMDAVLLSKAVNGSVAISDAQKISMDCDGDGDITANDTTALMQFLVHLVDTLPLKYHASQQNRAKK